MWDLRTPSGFFFLLLGAVLVVLGLTSPARAPLTYANVNLAAGLAMLVFGGALLWLSKRKA